MVVFACGWQSEKQCGKILPERSKAEPLEGWVKLFPNVNFPAE